MRMRHVSAMHACKRAGMHVMDPLHAGALQFWIRTTCCMLHGVAVGMQAQGLAGKNGHCDGVMMMRVGSTRQTMHVRMHLASGLWCTELVSSSLMPCGRGRGSRRTRQRRFCRWRRGGGSMMGRGASGSACGRCSVHAVRTSHCHCCNPPSLARCLGLVVGSVDLRRS